MGAVVGIGSRSRRRRKDGDGAASTGAASGTVGSRGGDSEAWARGDARIRIPRSEVEGLLREAELQVVPLEQRLLQAGALASRGHLSGAAQAQAQGGRGGGLFEGGGVGGGLFPGGGLTDGLGGLWDIDSTGTGDDEEEEYEASGQEDEEEEEGDDQQN